MGRWPREAARWRLELERPSGEVSGLWRSLGWDLRMRSASVLSLAWMARRRRRGASILPGLLSVGLLPAGVGARMYRHFILPPSHENGHNDGRGVGDKAGDYLSASVKWKKGR